MRRAVGRVAAVLCLLVAAFHGGERVLDLAAPYPQELLRRPVVSRVFLARDSRLLRAAPTPLGERCLALRPHDVAPVALLALFAAEDGRFREHDGVDLAAAMRAAASSLFRGRVVSGASTITMQVVRLVEPHPRTLVGKIVEMLRARQLERVCAKDEILSAYLTRVPFGGTTRGLAAAAWRWYGKPADLLTAGEAATLFAMLPLPTARAPDLGGAARLRAARDRVLERMLARGSLDAAGYDRARAEALPTARRPWPYLAPHHCDLCARQDDAWVVHTTLDLDLQRRVETTLRRLPAPGVGGVAAVVLRRATGHVLAHVGSRDYRTAPLDAALCHRSVGSTLKPFLFALATDLGVTGPDVLVADTPLAFADYAPRNFEGAYEGALPAAEALARSRNLPAVRELRAVGPERFRDLLRVLGISVTAATLHVDAALGTVAASPLELAHAWQRFAGPGDVPGLSRRAREQTLAALSSGGVARKTGTSSGRRDAWCVAVTRDHVVVGWYGNLDGRGAPDLVGGGAARDLVDAVVAATE